MQNGNNIQVARYAGSTVEVCLREGSSRAGSCVLIDWWCNCSPMCRWGGRGGRKGVAGGGRGGCTSGLPDSIRAPRPSPLLPPPPGNTPQQGGGKQMTGPFVGLFTPGYIAYSTTGLSLGLLWLHLLLRYSELGICNTFRDMATMTRGPTNFAGEGCCTRVVNYRCSASGANLR